MENSSYEIEKIRHEIFQKEMNNKKIKELENLIKNQYISKKQAQVIHKKIEELKYESSNNQSQGIEKLKKFRLSLKKTSEIDANPKYIYPELLESGNIIMFFGNCVIGKTL